MENDHKNIVLMENAEGESFANIDDLISLFKGIIYKITL